jgi:hypothetical protein
VTDLAKWVKTDCGTLQEVRFCSGGQCEDIVGTGLFVTGHGLYYLPDLALQTPLPAGPFQASGLFAPYVTIPEGVVIAPTAGAQKDGGQVLLHSVLMPCPPVSCCESRYAPHDRVRLLVDEPGGAEGLFAEATGSVVCCNSRDPNTPVLVSWDFWTGGHDEDEKCDCCDRPFWYAETSGWWVACSEIERIILADVYDVAESYRGFSPTSVVAGQAGQGLAITSLIANRGGQPSGSFFVDLYASSDDEITSADYFLGMVGMSIDAGGLANLDWVDDFPTDIPAGTYHIGWLIDPDNFVEEDKETNNMAVIEAGQLLVTAP